LQSNKVAEFLFHVPCSTFHVTKFQGFIVSEPLGVERLISPLEEGVRGCVGEIKINTNKTIATLK